MENSPITDTDIDWESPDEIAAILMFRVSSTDEEWEEDPASFQWDLSREEAAERLDSGDFSSPLPL